MAGFVIGERSVLVVESMLNGDLASQLIGLVRQATTKPIRFLVNTSYHGDHAYGNYLFPDSTVVIQYPATKRYMEENFEDDRRFMIAPSSIGHKPPVSRLGPSEDNLLKLHTLVIGNFAVLCPGALSQSDSILDAAGAPRRRTLPELDCRWTVGMQGPARTSPACCRVGPGRRPRSP
jgi:hypothetical protein